MINVVEEICAEVQSVRWSDGGDSVFCGSGRLFRFIEFPVEVVKKTEDVGCF